MIIYARSPYLILLDCGFSPATARYISDLIYRDGEFCAADYLRYVAIAALGN